MKIVFEKEDEQLMNGLRFSKESGKNEPPFLMVYDGQECSINFTVIDSIKASTFMFELLRTDDAGRKYIEDAIGIHVETSSDGSDSIKLHKMKKLIKEFESKAKEILK